MLPFFLGILLALYSLFALVMYLSVDDYLNDLFCEEIHEKPELVLMVRGLACIAGLFWLPYLTFFLLPKYGVIVGKKLYKKLERMLEV